MMSSRSGPAIGRASSRKARVKKLSQDVKPWFGFVGSHTNSSSKERDVPLAAFAVVVLTCLVLSLRFLMYSAAMAPHLRSLEPRWRNLLAFLLTDQAFAATIRRFRESDDTRANASYFLGSGLLLWITWGASTLAGVLLGAVIPASWGLEFVVPLCFIAILAPLLRDRVSMVVFAAAAVAVVALDALPMRLSLICAGLLAIICGMVAERLFPQHG